MTVAMLSPRRAVSPYARRLARERGIGLDELSGSGPAGRIVAADVLEFVPRPTSALPGGDAQPSAITTTIALSKMRLLLADFSATDTAFSLEDVVIRAAGCALDDVAAATPIEGAPVAFETRLDNRPAQLVFDNVRKGSLAPLRERRLAAVAAAVDQAHEPAAISVRVVAASDIRPVTMPLLRGRSMRLVLVAGEDSAECLLVFDAGTVDEDAATEVLSRIKAYLEVPIRLLA